MLEGGETMQPQTIQLTAKDGYPLYAIHYPCQTSPIKGSIIVASATAVAQRFYKRFALYLSQRGYNVWTLDYRGIGLSKPKTLVGFEVEYLDWAKKDLSCLVDHVASKTDGPIYWVGHSYGGHAIGLIDKPELIKSFVTFAMGAGWSGWMPQMERLRVAFLWRIAGPLLVWSKGYMAWNMIGMGEDLPRDIFYQWKRWCTFPHYFFDDPTMKSVVPLYERVSAPFLAINSIDDKWATPKSRDAFLKGFKNAKIQTLDVNPRDLGLKQIGHMNYFRQESIELWEKSINFLEQS